MNRALRDWLLSLEHRPGGDILAVQTLRNSLMAASVLASAALVGLMGVLATAHLHPRWSSASAAALLVFSMGFSLRTLWTISSIGFNLRIDSSASPPTATMPLEAATLSGKDAVELVNSLGGALRGIRWSGLLLLFALTAAAASIWMH
jgi:Protein of unknown function, DUF599